MNKNAIFTETHCVCQLRLFYAKEQTSFEFSEAYWRNKGWIVRKYIVIIPDLPRFLDVRHVPKGIDLEHKEKNAHWNGH